MFKKGGCPQPKWLFAMLPCGLYSSRRISPQVCCCRIAVWPSGGAAKITFAALSAGCASSTLSAVAMLIVNGGDLSLEVQKLQASEPDCFNCVKAACDGKADWVSCTRAACASGTAVLPSPVRPYRPGPLPKSECSMQARLIGCAGRRIRLCAAVHIRSDQRRVHPAPRHGAQHVLCCGG